MKTGILIAGLLAARTMLATPIVISGVPAYEWYHGCTPTAVGSVFGYWDMHGFDNLFDASGASVYSTWSVNNQISSLEHNAKYDPDPDNSSLAAPPDTSIADFLHTSEGERPEGGTYVSDISSGVAGYAAYRGYQFSSTDVLFGAGLTWSDVTQEIDAGRPLLFAVDSNGDGTADHSVPVLGYDVVGTTQYYGFYTTWNEQERVVWKRFRYVAPGQWWGVYDATFVRPLLNGIVVQNSGSLTYDGEGPLPDVPEPMTACLLGSALAALMVSYRKRS